MFSIDRRSLLLSATVTAGALSLGFRLGDAESGDGEINAWIVLRDNGEVVVRSPRAEMGQGVATALAMLVAEELECDWDKVRTEAVQAGENRKRNLVWGDMTTGASRSVSSLQEELRTAGAIAREMLLAAAAARWGAPVAECRARNGLIVHIPTGRTLAYAALAQSAASIVPPERVRLKQPGEWTLIGTRRATLDAADAVSGKPVYGVDVRAPRMLHAAIKVCPVFGGALKSVDESASLRSPGVHRIVKLPDAVAVVAETWWKASQTLERLSIEWEEPNESSVSSIDIARTLRTGLSEAADGVGRQVGDVEAALGRCAHRIEAEYSAPFLHHAGLEPLNCTASVRPDAVEVWAPTQNPEAALETAALAAGVSAEKVVLHRTKLGGGFGRTVFVQDHIRQAVLIAKELDRPVKVVWSREEDMRHAFYRPAVMARMTAGLDEAGRLLAWSIRIAGQSLLASVAPELAANQFDRFLLDGLLEEMPYAVPNYRVDLAARESPVPVGPWRSVHHSQNAFFKECFIDELAHAAARDPLELRRELLAGRPRELAVLNAAAERADWRRPPPEGVGRGLAMHEMASSICAHIIEASVSQEGVHVHRVVSAIDVGHAVNPAAIEAQNEGAIAFALSAALFGEITIANGRVEQSNFHDYRLLRLAEMPRVETVILASGDHWGGVGEPPVPPVAPALCNAIFSATGVRIRALPVKNHKLHLG